MSDTRCSPCMTFLFPSEAPNCGERPVAKALRLLGKLAQGKLTYSEVRLLLAGARFAERYAPDLHHRLMGAGVFRLASHLATPVLLGRGLGQDNLPSHMSQSVVRSPE